MRSEPPSHYRFDDFDLFVDNRQFCQDGKPLGLNGRYFDALVLLVQEHGQLVEKERFFTEIWGSVIVSDSALTQCIKEIRKLLGDHATNPRYIQTVPGHGYRFVRPVETNPSLEVDQKSSVSSPEESLFRSNTKYALQRVLIMGGSGTLGGIGAGMLGGLFYGFGLAYAPGDTAIGATSMLLVLTSLNVIIGGMGGLGVSFGMATGFVNSGASKIWTVVGATLGGLIVGSITKLLGVDAFRLLFGTAPEGITGGLEGAVLGAAVALGVSFCGGLDTHRKLRTVVGAASASGIAGVLISIAGGRLMSGSLELLARSFSGSQLRLDLFGRFFGEDNFGFITQTILAGVEGFLFGACVVGAILLFKDEKSRLNQ